MFQTSPASDFQPETSQVLDEDQSIAIAAEAVLACHARGVDNQTMAMMCERLLAVTERQMLARENRMMATGDDNLAAQVRRHGDVLLVLSQQVKACRRQGGPLPKTFIQFVGSLAERFRGPRIEAA